MESDNKNNNGGEEQQQQLRRSARKRKFNELANDDQPAATDEKQKQHQPPENLSKKKREQQENDDLELGSHSRPREDLIDLVRMTKKEAEESAKQAQEFSQRNIQLEQDKAELHEGLNKNLAEIAELHKEVEKKSEEVAEKAKQIDELLMQLNKSTREQHQMATELQMKIQLSLETWYDMLAFVPRHRLGKVVPMIGDRRFASIVQKFLHKYGEIMIDRIEIVAPYEEDPNGPHPRVRAWQNNRPLRFEIAEAQMPANIKNFSKFELSYFDETVLNFMQKFQQNGLLDNVNLSFAKLSTKGIIQPVLYHLLSLINGIVSIELRDSAQLVDLYDAGNSKEINELSMKMMEETRFLGVSWDPKNLDANKMDLYCRWLYQTARADGKPRMLELVKMDMNPAPISLFIDRLKQDFLMATDPVTFFIRIILPKAFQPAEGGICLVNGKTKERLLTKMEKADPILEKIEKIELLVSRYPLASAGKEFIVGEGMFEKTIYLTKELKGVAI